MKTVSSRNIPQGSANDTARKPRDHPDDRESTPVADVVFYLLVAVALVVLTLIFWSLSGRW